MKKAQKILCLLLAALMLVSLAACNGSTSTDTDAKSESAGGADTNDKGEQIPGVPTETYDGYDFTVYMTCRNPDTVIVRDFEMTEDNANANVLNEALYKRNTQMESEFDIKINPIVDYQSNHTSTTNVRKANTSGASTYDLCILGTYSASTLAMSGDLVDLNDYGEIDLSKSWWDQNINRDLTVNGKVFFTTGDISLVATQAMYNLVFNKTMFDEMNWEYPYELVKEGKWTFDKLKEYSLKVSADLNADDTMGQDDKYGFGYINSTCMAFLNSAGEKIAGVNSDGEFELSITSERSASVVTSFIEFTKSKNYAFNAQTGTDGQNKTAIGMFAEGQLLFRAVEHLGFAHLRDTELKYGILPLPKFDETQEEYYTPVGSWDGAYVCVPTFTDDEERTSTIIERTAYISSEIVTPAYYSRTLEGKYVKDEDSYDMITLEMESRIYDPGYMFNFGGMTDAITKLSTTYSVNYASMLKANQSKAEQAITTTNEEFKKSQQ